MISKRGVAHLSRNLISWTTWGRKREKRAPNSDLQKCAATITAMMIVIHHRILGLHTIWRDCIRATKCSRKGNIQRWICSVKKLLMIEEYPSQWLYYRSHDGSLTTCLWTRTASMICLRYKLELVKEWRKTNEKRHKKWRAYIDKERALLQGLRLGCMATCCLATALTKRDLINTRTESESSPPGDGLWRYSPMYDA